MELFLAFCAWALKELYQSFKGSRAKTLQKLDEQAKQILELKILVETQSVKIDTLKEQVSIYSEKRAYRK